MNMLLQLGSTAAVQTHHALELCSNLSAAYQTRRWTLQDAQLHFPQQSTTFLPRCFSITVRRHVLSAEQRADLSFAAYAVDTGLSRDEHAELVKNLLPQVAKDYTEPAPLRTVMSRLERGGHYPPMPWDQESIISLSVSLGISPKYHLQPSGAAFRTITLRFAHIMHALVESLFDLEVIGNDPAPYVLNAAPRYYALS